MLFAIFESTNLKLLHFIKFKLPILELIILTFLQFNISPNPILLFLSIDIFGKKLNSSIFIVLIGIKEINSRVWRVELYKPNEIPNQVLSFHEKLQCK